MSDEHWTLGPLVQIRLPSGVLIQLVVGHCRQGRAQLMQNVHTVLHWVAR
jgi:ribosomal protein L1